MYMYLQWLQHCDGFGVFVMKGTQTMHAYPVNAKVHNHDFAHTVNPLPLAVSQTIAENTATDPPIANKPIHVRTLPTQ